MTRTIDTATLERWAKMLTEHGSNTKAQVLQEIEKILKQ